MLETIKGHAAWKDMKLWTAVMSKALEVEARLQRSNYILTSSSIPFLGSSHSEK